MTAAAQPVLWHLKVSNYNEKARWALDYKRVPHTRRALAAGRHVSASRRLGGSGTTPVLQLDGEVVDDSTAIIARLEERHPSPPLYPADPEERRRALELEDFFDEELGAYIRRLAIAHMLPEPRLFLGAFAPDARGLSRRMAIAAFPLLRRGLVRQFEIDDDTVATAFAKIAAAGDHVGPELARGAYLVGDQFTVADLTLAALVAPAIAPPQFPYPQPQRDHPRLAPLRKAIAEAGITDFALRMYTDHRGSTAET